MASLFEQLPESFLELQDLRIERAAVRNKEFIDDFFCNALRTDDVLPQDRNKKNTTLIAYYSGPTLTYQGISSISLYFPASRLHLFADIKEAGYSADPLEQTPSWYLFHAQLNDQNRNTLLSLIFESFLVLGRPLRDYRASFFIPLDPFSSQDIKAGKYRPTDLLLNPTIKEQVLRYTAKNTPPEEAKEAAEARLYFKPHLKDFLFYQGQDDTDLQPIKEYRLDSSCRYGKKPLLLSVSEKKENIDIAQFNKKDAINGRVEEIRLHQFYNHLALLQITVRGDNFSTDSENHSWKKECNPLWWEDILLGQYTDPEHIQGVQTNVWLKYTKLVRQLFPTFIEQAEENKIGSVFLWTEDKSLFSKPSKVKLKADEALDNHATRHRSDHYFAYWLVDLIKDFYRTKKSYEPFDTAHLHMQTIDMLDRINGDRAFVSSVYTACGTAPKKATEVINKAKIKHHNQEHILSLMTYVDDDTMTFSDLQDFSSDPYFVKERLSENQYNRWRDLGTYFNFCEYAHTSFGYDNYFKKNISASHIPNLYERMLVVNLFYRQSLSHYERRISEIARLAHGDARKYRKHMTSLKKEMILFTNHYWFSELSNQIQGQEIYQHQLKSLKLKEQYEEIKEQLHWTQDFTLNESMRKLTFWAVIFAAVTLVATVMNSSLINTLCNWVKELLV